MLFLTDNQKFVIWGLIIGQVKSFLKNVWIRSGAYPASFAVDTGGKVARV
jgi:hypothetical protein